MMKVVVVWVALVTSMYGISQGIRPSGGKSMGMANASVCTRYFISSKIITNKSRFTVCTL
ncbi:MAG: hypothetical protein P8O87_05400 [Crocinitomicaceae bacterium]|nr:hypothetical protein [Crocinitomicaceae bacterium]